MLVVMRCCGVTVAAVTLAGCAALAGLDRDYAVGAGGDGGAAAPTGAAATGGTGQGGSNVSGGSGGTSTAGTGGSSSSGGSSAGGTGPVDPCAEAGIVACYRFEQDVLDSSAAQNHATATNVSYVTGHDGMALHHAVGSLVEAPAAPLALSPLTIEFWMRPASLPTSGRTALVDHAGRYGMFILAGGVIQCRAAALVSGSVVTANVWTHVACTFSDSEIQIYLDGVLDVAAPNTPLDTTPSTIFIGSNYPSGEELVGELDEFRIFNLVRSPQQICHSAGLPTCP